MLNYGYAVLRAATARAVVGAGLLAGLGVFHSNRGDAFALASDLMEPFRPVIDLRVWLLRRGGEEQITPDTKRALVRTLYDDMQTSAGATPVTVCAQRLATSLAQVYLGEREKLFQSMVAKSYEVGKATNIASVLEIDQVIDPVETRRWIIRGLDSCPAPRPRATRKRPFVDTW